MTAPNKICERNPATSRNRDTRRTRDIGKGAGLDGQSSRCYPVIQKTEFIDPYRLIPKVMAFTSDSIKNEIDRLYDELKAIRGMEDAEVCEEYNVDEKNEAVELLLEEIDDLWNDYGRLVDIEEREERLEKESIMFALRNPVRQLLMDN